MKRRDFITTTGIIALGTTPLISGCPKRNTFSNASLNNGNELRVHKVEFSTKLVKETTDKKYILLKHPEHRFPICLFKFEGDQRNKHQYHATLMQCTHQKCQTSVDDQGIVCPCHGSRFTNTGKLLKGPAEKDLDTFKVEVKGDYIHIKLS